MTDLLTAAEHEIDRMKGDRAALDVAVTGLRDLEDLYDDAAAQALADGDDEEARLLDRVRRDLSSLLDRIGPIR